LESEKAKVRTLKKELTEINYSNMALHNNILKQKKPSIANTQYSSTSNNKRDSLDIDMDAPVDMQALGEIDESRI